MIIIMIIITLAQLKGGNGVRKKKIFARFFWIAIIEKPETNFVWNLLKISLNVSFFQINSDTKTFVSTFPTRLVFIIILSYLYKRKLNNANTNNSIKNNIKNKNEAFHADVETQRDKRTDKFIGRTKKHANT